MAAPRNTSLGTKLAGLGLAAQACLVAAVLAAAALGALPLAVWLSGALGAASVAVAAAICLGSSWLSLVVGALFPGPQNVLQRLALGMLARTGLPLVLGVTLAFRSASLAAGGMIYYLLVFYMLSLALETALLVAGIPRSTSSPQST